MSDSIVRKVLDDLGVDYEEKGNNFVVCCPYHNENTPSMNIDKESGLHYCFGCHEKGNLPKLVMTYSDVTYVGALQYLNSLSTSFFKKDPTGSYRDLVKKLERRGPDTEKKISTDVPLPPNVQNFQHPYIKKRGFTEAECIYHDMRIVSHGAFRGWLLIPIYKDGVLRTYFLRETTGGGKVYGYYSKIGDSGELVNVGYPRPDILYGMDDCTDYDKPLVIAEGIFDSIYNKRVMKQSVALLSNRILEGQKPFLEKFKDIIVVPDNDNQGLFLVKDMLQFRGKINIRVAQLPHGKKDSAECSSQELASAIFRSKSIYDFIVGDRYKQFNIFLENLKKSKTKH